MPITLHSHTARALHIPASPLRPLRRTPRGERLAWRLVGLLAEQLRRDLRGPRR